MRQGTLSGKGRKKRVSSDLEEGLWFAIGLNLRPITIIICTLAVFQKWKAEEEAFSLPRSLLGWTGKDIY
jgi:hypothetical protein